MERLVSMKLTPDDLLGIAGKVREIAGLGVMVETFRFGSHRVMLRWEGPDGNPAPVVIGITEGDWAAKVGTALREYEKLHPPGSRQALEQARREALERGHHR
jgi:hypothetical protein